MLSRTKWIHVQSIRGEGDNKEKETAKRRHDTMVGIQRHQFHQFKSGPAIPMRTQLDQWQTIHLIVSAEILQEDWYSPQSRLLL